MIRTLPRCRILFSQWLAMSALAMSSACVHGGEPSPAADLDSPVAAVRQHAVRTLAGQGDAAALPKLLEALTDKAACVRSEAAKGLGRFKQTESVKGLVAALRDGDMNVRMYAAYALGEIKDPAAADALLPALQDKAWCVRDQAAWALRELRNDAIVNGLKQQLKDGKVDPQLTQWIIQGKDALPPVADAPQANPNRRPHPLALMGHWHFDDKDPQTARDATGGGNHGQINGCKPAPGKKGAALAFKDDAIVSLGKPVDLDMGRQPFTVMAWINTTSPDGVVVARGGAWCGFSLFIQAGMAKFGIHLTQEGPTYITEGEPIPAETWVHVAGVVHEKSIAVYINGKAAGKADTPGFIPSNCGQGMEIGGDLSNSPVGFMARFQGRIDEVMFFAKSLTAPEIKKMMESGE